MNFPLETNNCLLNKMVGRSFFNILLSSLLATSYAYAEFSLHGEINFDLGKQQFQENHLDQDVPEQLRTPPVAQVSKSIFNLEYSIKKKISARMRFGSQVQPRMNFWDDHLFYQDTDTFKIINAYAHMQVLNGMSLDFGLIPITEMFCAQADHYRFTIDPSLGHLVQGLNQKMGISFGSSQHPISFQTAIWNQTYIQPISAITGTTYTNLSYFSDLNGAWTNALILEDDYRDRSVKLGYSGSLAFVPSEYDEIGSSLSLAFVSSPLNQPYILATLGAMDSDTSVGLSIYN